MTVLRYATEEEKTTTNFGVVATASSRPKELVLYGKPTAVVLGHEIAHFKLGHLETEEDSPNLRIDDEIDAWLETYSKLGRPRSLYRRLGGIVSDNYETWGTNPRATMIMLTRKFKEPGIPDTWKRSLSKLDSYLKSKGY